ncbi:DUF4185 domain-containing protein [Streptomyces sp. NPDC054933]
MCLVGALGLAGCSVEARQDAGCSGVRISSWAEDGAMTGEFSRYGDDGSRSVGWTGGDGTHSVRLPDGRTLWLADDPFLDRAQPPPNQLGQPYWWRDTSGGRMPAWVHNAVLVMDRTSRLRQTLLGGTTAEPGSYFPDLNANPQIWRWPMQAVVEPRTPGAAEQVVRVLLWDRAVAPAPWLYGVPLATEVATLSLPDLRLTGIAKVSDQWSVPAPGQRVLFGTTAVRQGSWTYVFGSDDGPGRGAASSRAYLARIPAGRLADAAAWRYWDGGGWQPLLSRAKPVLGNGGRQGVGTGYSVVRQGGTWVLLTMDAGGPAASGLTTLTSYWACSPQGPWHGPDPGFDPPLPQDGEARGNAAIYNPQAHPEFTTGDGLLVGYDVNWLGSPAAPVDTNVNRDVALYRPRFMRLRLSAPGA